MALTSFLAVRVVTADRRSRHALRRQTRHALQVCVRDGLPQNALRRRRLLRLLHFGRGRIVGGGRSGRRLCGVLRLARHRTAARQRARRQREALQGTAHRWGGTVMRACACGGRIRCVRARVAAVRGRGRRRGRRWVRRGVGRRWGGRVAVAARERDLQIGGVFAALRVAALLTTTRRRRTAVGGRAARVLLLAVVLVADVVVRPPAEATRQRVEEAEAAVRRRGEHRRRGARLGRRYIHAHDALVFHCVMCVGFCWDCACVAICD